MEIVAQVNETPASRSRLRVEPPIAVETDPLEVLLSTPPHRPN